MIVMSGLCHLWSHEEFRRSLIAALRGWNSALSEGWPEQLRAAGQLKQIFDRYNSTSVLAEQQQAHAMPETPVQTLDRLLDFPSRRLAVYGSLAPGKKNHNVIAGMEGRWRNAVLRGSLRNEGWGAGEGFPGFVWDGSYTTVAALVFSSAELPHYWPRLDEFEGKEYQRILAPAEVDGGSIEICNVYALGKG